MHAIEINASLIRSWGVRCGRLRGVRRLAMQSTGLHYNRDKRLIKFLSSRGNSHIRCITLHQRSFLSFDFFHHICTKCDDFKRKNKRWIIINITHIHSHTYTYIIYYLYNRIVLFITYFIIRSTQYYIYITNNKSFQKRNYLGNYFMCHISLIIVINKIWTPCS